MKKILQKMNMTKTTVFLMSIYTVKGLNITPEELLFFGGGGGIKYEKIPLFERLLQPWRSMTISC
ncbi:MAG: hypothetical protein LBC27_03665 [Spirochaetaceae bacterium]|nr:hypothetical protein [Spirochaetaceae bacterium]